MNESEFTQFMKKKDIPYWLLIILLILMYTVGYFFGGIYT